MRVRTYSQLTARRRKPKLMPDNQKEPDKTKRLVKERINKVRRRWVMR